VADQRAGREQGPADGAAGPGPRRRRRRCGGWWSAPKTYELVGCWEGEKQELQARFDAERAAREKEVKLSPAVAKAKKRWVRGARAVGAKYRCCFSSG